MTLVLYFFLYAGAACFLTGCAVKIRLYTQAPLHLRWELYPVPRGRSGQAKAMFQEILFLRNLWQSNRPLWYRSFAFHFGLYLLVATGAILLLSFAFPVLHGVCYYTGCAGLTLALIGSVLLLDHRLTAPEFRNYTTSGDLFNLFLFSVTLAFLLASVLWRPAGAAGIFAVLRGAATFRTGLDVPSLLTAGLITGSVLLAYMPLTFMAHFIGKYFTYHAVRWDETPNLPGSAIEKRMAAYLMYRPNWSASHVGANGARTWVDIATANPAKGPLQ